MPSFYTRLVYVSKICTMGPFIQSRRYITAQETMDCFPNFQTMVPDEPDFIGVEHMKLLKQELKEQSRLEVLLGNGDMEEVERYYRMAEPLWKKVKKQIKGRKACARIVHAFQEDMYDVTKPMLRGVLLKLLKNQKYVPAWSLANYIVRSKTFEKDDMDQLFQISCAALADCDRSAENLFENLPRNLRNQKAFHAFMAGSAFNRNNRVRMEKLLQELKEKGWYTEPFALNQMMLLYEQPNMRKKVPLLFEEAKSLGIKPDVRSYNIYIGSMVKEKDVSGMEEVLQMLEDDPDVSPDESTYFILACGYISAGCFEKAGKILVKVEQLLQDGVFRRKQTTYNKLLRLYGDTNDSEGVESVWGVLSTRPLRAAVESYGYAIQAFGKTMGVPRAEELFAKVDGLRETNHAIAMMSVYTNTGYMDKAKELFQFLPRKRMKHRLTLYRYMIAGYLKDGQPRKALQVFNLGCTVLRHRCACKSWERVLLSLMDHFASRGEVQTIEKLFQTNPELKEFKDIGVYRIMLKAYLNQKAPLQRFLNWTDGMGLSPDAETRKLLLLLQKQNKQRDI